MAFTGEKDDIQMAFKLDNHHRSRGKRYLSHSISNMSKKRHYDVTNADITIFRLSMWHEKQNSEGKIYYQHDIGNLKGLFFIQS